MAHHYVRGEKWVTCNTWRPWQNVQNFSAEIFKLVIFYDFVVHWHWTKLPNLLAHKPVIYLYVYINYKIYIYITCRPLYFPFCRCYYSLTLHKIDIFSSGTGTIWHWLELPKFKKAPLQDIGKLNGTIPQQDTTIHGFPLIYMDLHLMASLCTKIMEAISRGKRYTFEKSQYHGC